MLHVSPSKNSQAWCAKSRGSTHRKEWPLEKGRIKKTNRQKMFRHFLILCSLHVAESPAPLVGSERMVAIDACDSDCELNRKSISCFEGLGAAMLLKKAQLITPASLN